MAARDRRLLGSLLSFLLVLTACGGGGGGGGGGPPGVTPALFNGVHDYMGLVAQSGPPLAVASQRGPLTADGVSMLSLTVTENVDGVITPQAPSGLGYALDAARNLRWQATPMTDIAAGGISADGRLAVLGTVQTGSFPALIFAGKRVGPHGAASLSGAYHVFGFVHDWSGPQDLTVFGTCTFDGVGTASLSALQNAGGSIAGPFPDAGTYTVSPDGVLDYTFGFGQVFQGGVYAGGSLAVTCGATSAGGDPALFVFVKAGAGLGNATLSRSYFIAGFQRDLSADWASATGTLVANGTGSATVTLTTNDGTIGMDPPVMLSYAVAADGATTYAVGDTFAGAVSADGGILVLAGGTSVLSNPVLFVGIRWRSPPRGARVPGAGDGSRTPPRTRRVPAPSGEARAPCRVRGRRRPRPLPR
jgi:hypothetical protein